MNGRSISHGSTKDPSEIHGDNLNNIRLEARKHLRNIKRKYRGGGGELANNSNNKNIRDLYIGIH
jgi:hypothetical protein